MVFLKEILPFFTFVLGVFLAPYIETRKEKAKIESLKKNILIELEDELVILERSIKLASDSINLRKFQSNKYQHLSLGKRFHPILLEKNINEVYSHFNRDTRAALKNLLLLSGQIKEKYDFISDNWKSNNSECRAKEESMLYSMLSVYYVLSKLKNEGDRFSLPNLSNEEVVDMAAKALHITSPFSVS